MITRAILSSIARWFVDKAIGRAILAGAALVAGLWAFGAQQQHKGAAKAVAEMKEATHAATSKGKSAADRSGAGGMSNPIDPGYRK